MPKPHAHLQTMAKGSLKFQVDRYKNCRRCCAQNVPTVIHFNCAFGLGFQHLPWDLVNVNA